MHGHRLVDDEAIAQKLADGLAGVGGGDLVNFIGIEPDLALAAADHGGRQALLGAKVDPAIVKKQWFFLSVRNSPLDLWIVYARYWRADGYYCVQICGSWAEWCCGDLE